MCTIKKVPEGPEAAAARYSAGEKKLGEFLAKHILMNNVTMVPYSGTRTIKEAPKGPEAAAVRYSAGENKYRECLEKHIIINNVTVVYLIQAVRARLKRCQTVLKQRQRGTQRGKKTNSANAPRNIQ